MNRLAHERSRRREDLVALASRYADRVSSRFAPATVLLYGSVARGDFNIWSDVDVLVISDALPHDPLVRTKRLYECVYAGIEPKGLTLNEYKKAKAEGHPFVKELAEHAIVLRDDLKLEK